MAQEQSTTSAPGAPLARSSGEGSDISARTPRTSGVEGVTKIADSVVSRIAGLAAREVPGVHDLTTQNIGQAFRGLPGRVTGQEQADRGVAVQVGEVECIVDLNIVVDYEASIPHVAAALRRNISQRLQAMTGLETKEININVADLYFPGEERPSQPPQPSPPPPPPAVR